MNRNAGSKCFSSKGENFACQDILSHFLMHCPRIEQRVRGKAYTRTARKKVIEGGLNWTQENVPREGKNGKT